MSFTANGITESSQRTTISVQVIFASALKSKNVSGTDILSLRDEDGSLHRISREWTSLATPSPFSPTSFAILHFEFLLKLAVFLEGLDHADIEKEVQEKELQNG
jgi:hypothetical protein